MDFVVDVAAIERGGKPEERFGRFAISIPELAHECAG
jgi:hypothetical protein